MTKGSTKKASTPPPNLGEDSPALDPLIYNNFIASLQLSRIELSELHAKAVQHSLEELTLQVGSKFSISCPRKDEESFTVEAQLGLDFLSDTDEDLGSLVCIYRLEYASDIPLTDEIFAHFSQRNVPLNVWPFIREMVMNITQRFGWSGFVLPPYKVPSMTPAPAQAGSKPSTPKKTTAKKAASKN
ncbi:hypothetical protein [Deinococcus marmoris]|uniref:hypothetical protein n=1 Tax=Deinococcus marmoris TaxID=249408 RepID=UPI0012DF4BEE|nr:hypothetical protein [Deinococcus marmoris]